MGWRRKTKGEETEGESGRGEMCLKTKINKGFINKSRREEEEEKGETEKEDYQKMGQIQKTGMIKSFLVQHDAWRPNGKETLRTKQPNS